MSYELHNLHPAPGSRRRARRYGRGHGSGRGKTAGRGTKGQKARTGGRRGLKRLGLRRTLLQQPKLRGFRSLRPKPTTVNVGAIAAAFPAGATVTPAAILAAGIVRSVRHGVKVLGTGTIAQAVTLKGMSVSVPAKVKVEAAGGHVEANSARA